DAHARESGAVITLDDPELGVTNQPGCAVMLSRTPSSVRGPRRTLDSDRAEILRELGALEPRPPGERPASSLMPRPSGERPASSASRVRGPLHGVRVVDVTQVLAGPTAARILAEYGADVVKVNSADDKQLGLHLYTNSGKRSILLNLKTEAGRALMARLL